MVVLLFFDTIDFENGQNESLQPQMILKTAKMDHYNAKQFCQSRLCSVQ